MILSLRHGKLIRRDQNSTAMPMGMAMMAGNMVVSQAWRYMYMM